MHILTLCEPIRSEHIGRRHNIYYKLLIAPLVSLSVALFARIFRSYLQKTETVVVRISDKQDLEGP